MNNEEMSDEQLNAEQTKFYSGSLAAISARKQEFTKGWWVEADAAEKIYLADAKRDSADNTPYNILYSNTEVLLPSLYSATPKPDVRSRYKDQNIKPIPDVLQRFLTVVSDPQDPGGDCFDTAMQDAVLSSLVPGMGYVRLRYVKEEAFPLKYESGHFKNLIWGKASRWSKVPWVAFEVTMRREQMLEQFGKSDEQAAESYIPSGETDDEKDTCTIYEFWDRKTKKVYFLSEEWREKVLNSYDDPLGLKGFFPTPGLMQMTVRGGKSPPLPLYNYYREQAEELNRVSIRLINILKAIKVRGFYNGLLGDDLQALLSNDDMENKMIQAKEAGLLAQSGGIDKHIWLLPIADLIVVAKELYANRETIKQVIYEITGISDIIRGSSAPSETATAQDLKNKWGTVRLRRMQTVVANYSRDLFRMSVDCGSDQIPADQWKLITQREDIPTAQEKAVAQQQLQYLQQQAQMQQMMAPPGMPQQPPPPPDPKLVQAAQSPSWEEILTKVKSDQNRTFIVNIQTSSTIDLDTAQDKAEVNEFMNAMGQLLPGLQGLGAIGPSGLEAAKEILIQVCKRFKFGIDIVDSIQKIVPPPPEAAEPKGPPPPTPEEMQAVKITAEAKIMKAQSDMRVAQVQEQAALAKVENEKQMMGIAFQEAQLRLEESRRKMAHEAEMRDVKVKASKAAANAPKPVSAGS